MRRGLLHFWQNLEFAAVALARLPVGLDAPADASGLPHLPQNLELLAFTVPQDRHAFDISASFSLVIWATWGHAWLSLTQFPSPYINASVGPVKILQVPHRAALNNTHMRRTLQCTGRTSPNHCTSACLLPRPSQVLLPS